SFHPSFAYFNPLVFFIIPYFPGLSLSGFLIGSSLAMYIFSIRSKLPTGRIFDVMILSLFPAAAVLFLWNSIQGILSKNIFHAVVYVCSTLLFALYFFIFKNFLAKSPWKDGAVSLLSLAVFSALQLLLDVVFNRFTKIPLETPIFAFFLAVLFIGFLIKKFRR